MDRKRIEPKDIIDGIYQQYQELLRKIIESKEAKTEEEVKKIVLERGFKW